MDDRLAFTNDPVAYPKERLRKVIAKLHNNNQHYSESYVFKGSSF
jgi:hypothetical protein